MFDFVIEYTLKTRLATMLWGQNLIEAINIWIVMRIESWKSDFEKVFPIQWNQLLNLNQKGISKISISLPVLVCTIGFEPVSKQRQLLWMENNGFPLNKTKNFSNLCKKISMHCISLIGKLNWFKYFFCTNQEGSSTKILYWYR